MARVAIEITGLTKVFGDNQVLRGVDLEIRKGEVTVLMGANGAGKSTLVKVICGVHAADGGEIKLNGKMLDAASPSEAIRAGIVTVHQNINDGVIPDLDVASNLMLDKLAEPNSGFFLNRRKIRAAARKIADSIGLDVDVSRPVRELDLADRQLVAIARAMTHEPELMILDEPTSSLSAKEANRLFELLDRLRETGVAILYISHRTSDIQRMADRIVSMRDGKIVARFETKPLDYQAAVSAMLGHDMKEAGFTYKSAGTTVLALESLQLKQDSTPIDLKFYKDEVVVITGLVGAGKTDLASILFGIRKPAGGKMCLDGAPYNPKSPGHAIGSGVFLCPKDRGSNGVMPGHNLTKNITMPFLSRYSMLSFVNGNAEATATRETIHKLNIVCQSESDDIGTLSGGNQQKIMVGRWLSEDSNLLILDEPFQGVDIQARRDICEKIRETAKGRATIVMASEMDEVVEIADRIIVLADYAVAGEHKNAGLDVKLLMAQVAGRQSNQSEAVRQNQELGRS